MKKAISIFIILFLLFIPSFSKAGILDNVINDGGNFLNAANNEASDDKNEWLVTSPNYKAVNKVSSDLYNILLYIGIALDVLVGAIIGIKFIIASVEEKAKVKEALLPYIIGSVIVFGAFTIWKIAINIVSKI